MTEQGLNVNDIRETAITEIVEANQYSLAKNYTILFDG